MPIRSEISIETASQDRYVPHQGMPESDSMVVCVCNAIREKDVRDAARAGAISPCQAYAALGRRPQCGQCVPYAREIISRERAAA